MNDQKTNQQTNNQRDDEKEKLRTFMQHRAFKKGSFTLASGKTSTYYFNSKNVILTAEGAYLTAKAILAKIKDLEFDALGGAAMGAVPITGALAPLLYESGLKELTFFIDRKQPKTHGDTKRIEGPDLKPGSRLVIVEDVVTTGGSSLATAIHLRDQGHTILKIVPILDRKEGAAQAFAKEGFLLDPVFTVDDFDTA